MKTFINWLKKPSISKKLIVSFIAILIIPILILEFSSYRSASGKLDQEIMGNAKNSVDTFNTTVTNDLREKAKAVTFFSESLKRFRIQIKKRSKLNFLNMYLLIKAFPEFMEAQITALTYKRLKRNCRTDTTLDNALGTRMR